MRYCISISDRSLSDRLTNGVYVLLPLQFRTSHGSLGRLFSIRYATMRSATVSIARPIARSPSRRCPDKIWSEGRPLCKHSAEFESCRLRPSARFESDLSSVQKTTTMTTTTGRRCRQPDAIGANTLLNGG